MVTIDLIMKKKVNTMDNLSIFKRNNSLLNIVYWLCLITIMYNIIEGIVALFFGFHDRTIALFGFGLDSFVEVISGIGIGHMIWRMKWNPVISWDKFERQSLFVAGIFFYILTVGLVIGSTLILIYNVKPNTTKIGIIISLLSILTTWILFRSKSRVGRELSLESVLADSDCTKTCIYMSVVLFVSSIFYNVFEISYIDVMGCISIAFFTFWKGKEAIEKARGLNQNIINR